jgi:hypothetical protein
MWSACAEGAHIVEVRLWRKPQDGRARLADGIFAISANHVPMLKDLIEAALVQAEMEILLEGLRCISGGAAYAPR